jgi:ABC-type uncharacterized transport system substrate-binding protein
MIFLIALFCLSIHAAFAHPHAFVECTFSFVMDENGLVGFREHWILDEMTTVAVLDVIDTDHDVSLSDKEKLALRELATNSLLDFHYFTAVQVNGRKLAVHKITDFSAELKKNKLIYDFLVPCPVAAIGKKTQRVKVAVYDDSFYTYVTYVQQGDAAFDPSRDKLFADRNAPARPEDFKRFAKSVGITKFKGQIPVIGDVANFELASALRDAPDMAYFYGQIIPQAFILEFKPR